MNITIIGTGYVGLTIGACLASLKHKVYCVDNNSSKINALKNNTLPLYEPGLKELINSNICFTTNIEEALTKSDICFITVGTPQAGDNSADLSYIKEVILQISKYINTYKLIVIKSTVPPGTNRELSKLLREHTSAPFNIISNPEFLRQGSAVSDFMHPDRVVIGADNKEAVIPLYNIYSVLTDKIIITDSISAELIKYASNSFLATKISFINEISNICQAVGGDIKTVEEGLGLDHRIGSAFLSSGIGYGGSCFPKDIRALIHVAESNKYSAELLKAVDNVNSAQVEVFLRKIRKRFSSDLSGLTFAVWGLTFKPNTDDLRESPAAAIVDKLVSAGASIIAYDPKVSDYTNIRVVQDMYSVFKNANALLVLTDWEVFKTPDFSKVNVPAIFDGRHIYNKKELIERGFEYYG